MAGAVNPFTDSDQTACKVATTVFDSSLSNEREASDQLPFVRSTHGPFRQKVPDNYFPTDSYLDR
ncbi:hypothetical protein RBSWK_00427 [Rhodopirellula baltica SWK14]|uniref:Uncharacterized protein n=1 Tax=Rhodopirellula baltica SWK14 TaxID=993516 RepID=L7CPY7_RHOBT|nr:hypothetical protein RBSWK_00427 [Rhodopirellula baltica SWK14]